MKLIYRIIAHYPKGYKIIKVGLLVTILLLTQVYVSLFHSELILKQQLKDENAPFTQIYAFRNEELDYPNGLSWFLNNQIDYEKYGIASINTSRAIILSDDLFLENNDRVMVQSEVGKPIQDLEGNEVAVSKAYAITHFGSVQNALGQVISEGVEKTMFDEEHKFEMKIAAIYSHSGLNRRFLNALSDYEYDPTGGNSVYAETIYVPAEEYYNYMTEVGNLYYITDQVDENRYSYASFDALRTRFVTKYTVMYDDYSVAKEQALGSELQIKSANYDAYYVIFQSLGNIINASALKASSIGFMSSFQFVSLFVLLTSIIFYLVYLQQVAVAKNERVLNRLGISQRKITVQKLLHELLIIGIGFGVWLLFNLSLQLIFGDRMLAIVEMFVFHRSIVVINLIVTLIVGLLFAFGARLLDLYPNVDKLFTKKRPIRPFNQSFYLRRLYQITPRRFIMMVVVGILCTGSFTILSRFESEINAIYVKEQPITSDFSVVVNYEQQDKFDLRQLQKYGSRVLYYQEAHNNIVFTRHIQQGHTNATKVTQANVSSFDLWDFIDFPTYPEMTDEQKQAIKANSSVILSRQLKESLDIADEVAFDFEEMYGEYEVNLETDEGTWSDDLDLFVVSPRYFQQWGTIEKGAKVRVLGFDNILDNNGYLYFNVWHPELMGEGLYSRGFERTPTTIHFLFDDDVKLSELKTDLNDLLARDKIESYQIGMDQEIFDYTADNTKITTFLLWITFTLYGLLIVLLFVVKDLNDGVLQAKNMQIYNRLGFTENVIGNNMRLLNIGMMIAGFLLGVLIVLVIWPLITYALYEVLVLFH